MSDRYHCRPVLHAGDGPAGPERVVRHLSRFDGPGEAAEFFVSEEIASEMRRERLHDEDQGQFDGAVYVVEVRHPDETIWQRFSVRVRVKLDIAATAVQAQEATR